MEPLPEKLEERTRDVEAILKNIRELRKSGGGPGSARA